MIVYRTNNTRNPPFLGQTIPETFFPHIFDTFSLFHTFSCNRKLPLKPFKKLEKGIFARAFKSFSPVIVLLEGKQTKQGEKS